MHILETQSHCPCKKKESEDTVALEHVSSTESLFSRDSVNFRDVSRSFSEENDLLEPSARVAEENARSNLKVMDALLNEQVAGLGRIGEQFKDEIGGFENLSLEKCHTFITSQYRDAKAMEEEQEIGQVDMADFQEELMEEIDHRMERKVTMR